MSGGVDSAVAAARAVDAGHDVVGVVTQPDRPAGRGRGVTQSAVKQEALASGFPVLQPEKPRGEEFMAQVRALDPDLSVVVAYEQILKPEILALPRLGSVNIHGSLLPELRGAGLPTLVVQGERDPMGRPEEFPGDLDDLDLVVVPGADHGLRVPARGEISQDEAMGIVVESPLEWLVREVVGNPRRG